MFQNRPGAERVGPLMSCFIVVTNQAVICQYVFSLHPLFRFQYQKHLKALTERLDIMILNRHKYITSEIIGSCLVGI